MRFSCPCCGFLTFGEETRDTYEVCPVCFWEDDPVQFEDPDYEVGANSVSLNQAKQNFKDFGSTEERFIKNVRKPLPKEIPPNQNLI